MADDGADPRYLEVTRHFAAIRALPPGEHTAALADIADPALRAEVASLLDFDDDTPLVRDPSPAPAPAARPPPALVGTRLDGRYVVESVAAEGGFGWVYRGRDTADDAPVAIKLLKPVLDPDAARTIHDAMAREARVLAELAADVPGIVGHRATGTWLDPDGEACPFLVLDWIDGPTLAADRRRQHAPPLSLDAAMALLDPIVGALRAAHERGIAHRDVKPENIIVAARDGRPTLVLIDFGAAKLAMERTRGFDSTAGQPGMVTYRYCAPEQLDRALGSTGPWSDVHALALLLVELLVGRHPWADLSLPSTIRAATDPAVRPTPARHGAAVSPAVEAAFAAALAVEPRRRPRDAGAFWQTLIDARAGRSPGLFDRLRRRVRRRRP